MNSSLWAGISTWLGRENHNGLWLEKHNGFGGRNTALGKVSVYITSSFWSFFLHFFGELECIGHSFAYVAHFEF
jgi:hypothetical protein